jgi:hypothetical protein
VPVLELDFEHRIRQTVRNCTLNFYNIIFSHVFLP